MSIESKIYLSEEVDNKDRRFGAALSYQPVMVVGADGAESKCLLT